MDDCGVAWWREPGHSPVYLVVDGGRVVACTPFAERWALGRTAAHLLERGRKVGATVEWIPLSAAPTLVRVPAGMVPVRRWRQDRSPLSDEFLRFGRIGDRWVVESTSEPVAWVYESAAEAWTDCQRRMRTGAWERLPARYGPQGERLAVADDPDLPDGLQDA